jgi:hypothetical protein
MHGDTHWHWQPARAEQRGSESIASGLAGDQCLQRDFTQPIVRTLQQQCWLEQRRQPHRLNTLP